MEKRRILWLNNQEIFFSGEVRLLKESGYEVFVPKKVPNNIDFSVTYDYDNTLSLKKEFIKKLNDTDFYTGEVCPELMKEINTHFSMCVISMNKNVMKMILNLFEGIICFRQGIEQEESMTQVIVRELGVAYLKRIEELGERFLYLPYEKELIKKESKYIKNHYKMVPLYLNHSIEQKGKPENRDVIISLTDIVTEDIQKQQELLAEYAENIIFSVNGERWVRHESGKRILDSNEHMLSLLYKARAIICFDMTPVKVKQVVLYAIEHKIPVFCMDTENVFFYTVPMQFAKSIDVLKKKLNSTKEIHKVLVKQSSILECYNQMCKKQNIAIALNDLNWNKVEVNGANLKKMKMAIVMPELKSFSQLERIIELTLGVKKGIDILGKNLQVVFAYPAGEKDILYKYLMRLEQNKVEIREFFFETISAIREQEIYNIMGYPLVANTDGKMMLNDGMNYFGDCNYILYTSDQIQGEIFSLQPYSVLVDEYMQRYIPALLGLSYEKSWIDFVRNADNVFTWTEATKNDCVQYAGASESIIKILPPIFAEVKDELNLKETSKKKYFIWEVGTNYVDNAILVALDTYYQRGGKLQCYVWGEKLNVADLKKRKTSNPVLTPLVKYLTQNKYMRMNMAFFSDCNRQEQHNIIRNAQFFLMSNVVEENYNRLYDVSLHNVMMISNNKPSLQEFGEIFEKKYTTYESVLELVSFLEKVEASGEKEISYGDNMKEYTLSNKFLCIELYNKICEKYLL